MPRRSVRRWEVLVSSLVIIGASLLAHAQATPATKPRGTNVSTDHLRISYDKEVSSSNDGSASLALDIVPRPGMHVYAPGANDYQVIRIVLSAPSSVEVRPIKYPASEIYFFEPLNERIPVYQKPFRLSVDVVNQGSSQGATRLKIAGQLEYQACDDKVCFAPVKVPLEWTILR